MDDRRWHAVLDRDSRADGTFVFAVRTTGIYCRPGCPARRPLRENVLFFKGPAEAEREGYRACRRCGPPARSLLFACELLANGPASLDRVARRAGWSPAALRRAFRRSLGVTPRQYLRELRFERFRARASSGVTPALLDAGFGSPSRLYESARARLGMTPATVAKQGAGMDIAFDIVRCPIGRALLAATPLGICAASLGNSARRLETDLRRRFPRARIRREPALLRFARARLGRILAGADPLLPLDVRATAFQARVWASLRSIPFGRTRTYAEVARSVGRPAAVRAVARACASNPVALVIPCHRVVGQDGSLRGYRWGVGRKRALLAMECRGEL